MAKIFLSIPILDRPELKMLYSVYQAILSCREHQVRVYFNENDSLISRVRNVHMSVFMDEFTECDYFVSIDSDIEILNAYPNNNIFTKLIEHNKDFVGGLYALKQDKTAPLCSSIPDLSENVTRENIQFDSGLLKMKWLSSGCWCIKRSAIEKMIKAYPELTYVGDDNMANRPIYGLCIPAIFNFNENGTIFKKYLSEDWSFCERWNKIGGEIYADTSIALKHIGKTSYSLWNFEITKEKRPVEPTKQQNQTNSFNPAMDLPPAGYDLGKI